MAQVSVRNSRSVRDDRRWIESVYRDYLTDLAPSATGIFPALGEIGHREPDQLMRWFGDTTAQVLTILYGEERVGFAMVTLRTRAGPQGSAAGGAAASGGATASGSAAAARPALGGGSGAATGLGPGAGPGTGPVAEFSMAEFFIARAWRRRGIGQQAVRLILDRFTGRWLITEDLRNTAAVKFWRGVVATYTGGKYQERIVNGEVHQRFESGSRRQSS